MRRLRGDCGLRNEVDQATQGRDGIVICIVFRDRHGVAFAGFLWVKRLFIHCREFYGRNRVMQVNNSAFMSIYQLFWYLMHLIPTTLEYFTERLMRVYRWSSNTMGKLSLSRVVSVFDDKTDGAIDCTKKHLDTTKKMNSGTWILSSERGESLHYNAFFRLGNLKRRAVTVSILAVTVVWFIPAFELRVIYEGSFEIRSVQ